MRTHICAAAALGLVLVVCAAPTAALADGLGDLLGFVGGKSITEDEARAIAEEAAGVRLVDAEFEERDLGAMTRGRFTLPPDETGIIWLYEVDMTHGVFSSWSSPNKLLTPAKVDDEPVLTREEATEATIAEARRHLGERVDELEWETNDWVPAMGGEVRAKTADLRLQVSATFDLTTGAMRSYWQMVLPPGPVHEPKVTLEEATEIVRQRMGGGEITIAGEPKLLQAPKMPVWSIRAMTLDRSESIFLLNGFTGEVLEEGRFLGDEGAHTDAPVPSRRSIPVPLLAAIGAALLLAAGAGVVLLMRRR